MSPARTFAVGDLHGCLDPLRRLLDRIGFDPGADRLLFVGDIVNRGPDSLGTLRFVRGLDRCATVLLGNHDLHLLAAHHGLRAPSPKDTLDEILAAPDRDELVDWLRRRPVLHVDETLGVVAVHAGIPADWSIEEARRRAEALSAVLGGDELEDFLARMYGNDPARWDEAEDRTSRLRWTVNAFTRMRFCRADGALDFSDNGAPADAPAGLVPWYRVRRDAPLGLPVVFGHWSAHPAMAPPGIVPTDRGCVWDGSLACLRLDDPGATMTSVPARAAPAAAVRDGRAGR